MGQVISRVVHCPDKIPPVNVAAEPSLEPASINGRRRPGPVRGGMWPPALLGSGARGVSVPLVRGSDCPPVLGFCPGDSLTSSLEG